MGGYYDEYFPLHDAPDCSHCGNSDNVCYYTVSDKNPNGNEGRSYWICLGCKPWSAGGLLERDWVTWDDDQGLESINPGYECITIRGQCGMVRVEGREATYTLLSTYVLNERIDEIFPPSFVLL
jgi:hypothetical protein